jgi:tRNA isopentenyl-2-thiomethyl-A-37 hydroxylase MiaE
MEAGDCFLYLADCQTLFPAIMNNFFNCHSVDSWCVDGGVTADPTGAVVIDYSICPGSAGRVPAGLERAQTARARSALGAYFAATAHLEAASVHAFRRLHRELAEHRAPGRLLRAARRAQRDEVRHAHQTGRMARRFGGAPVRPVVKHLPTRALDVVAIENAVEGCVRETFGALVASFQAAHAEDATIARMMSSIARDETRHAALSWSVARWAWGKLDAGARAQLVARCREAIEALRREADSGATGELAARAGLPSAEQHRALVSALEEQLWSGLLA